MFVMYGCFFGLNQNYKRIIIGNARTYLFEKILFHFQEVEKNRHFTDDLKKKVPCVKRKHREREKRRLLRGSQAANPLS